jgi:hypothetical protein
MDDLQETIEKIVITRRNNNFAVIVWYLIITFCTPKLLKQMYLKYYKFNKKILYRFINCYKHIY